MNTNKIVGESQVLLISILNIRNTISLKKSKMFKIYKLLTAEQHSLFLHEQDIRMQQS